MNEIETWIKKHEVLARNYHEMAQKHYDIFMRYKIKEKHHLELIEKLQKRTRKVTMLDINNQHI